MPYIMLLVTAYAQFHPCSAALERAVVAQRKRKTPASAVARLIAPLRPSSGISIATAPRTDPGMFMMPIARQSRKAVPVPTGLLPMCRARKQGR